MRRVGLCSAAVFLGVEVDNKVAGCIRATYDGARTIIHLLSVDRKFQKQNIGRTLVLAACTELNHRGAPTVAVTATEDSCSITQKRSYNCLQVWLGRYPSPQDDYTITAGLQRQIHQEKPDEPANGIAQLTELFVGLLTKVLTG